MRTTPILPNEARSPERRAQPRHGVLFRTVLIDSEIDGESAEIINIAPTGFLARTRITRANGSFIEIELPGLGQARAQVVWCGKGLLGAHFEQPMSDAAFHDLIQTLT